MSGALGLVRGGAALALLGAACRPVDPGELHRRWIEAENRGDVAGQVALLADDAVLTGWSYCRPVCTGKEAIRRELEGQLIVPSESSHVERSVSGGTVTARREVRSDGTRRAGVERIIVLDTFEVRGGMVVAIRTPMDDHDGPTATYLEFLRAQSGPLDVPIDKLEPPSKGARR